MKKKILIAISALLAVYIAFITVDCIRLNNAKTETKPIITLSLDEEETANKYTGLGYSVSYYKDAQDNSDNSIYGAEFRLFDKIMIWAWIE